MTKVRSRFIVAPGGGILILLGMRTVLASVIALVPLPVLGGAGIVLFGSVPEGPAGGARLRDQHGVWWRSC